MIALARRSFYLAAGHRRWPWALVVLMALAVSAVEAIGAILVFGLLALVTQPTDPVSFPLVGDVTRLFGDGAPRDVILTSALVVGGFFVARALIVVLMTYVQARVGQSAGARLATRLHRSYLKMPYITYVRTNSSEQIRNIHVTVPNVIADIFVLGTRAVSESIVVIVLGVILTVTAPAAMGIVVVVLAPAGLLMNRLLRPRLETLGREGQDIAARSLKVLQETLQGLREIRAHRREEHFSSIFASISYSLARNKARRTVLRSLPSTAVETVLVLFICAFLIATVVSGFDRAELLPVLGMFAYAGFRLKPSLNQIFEGINAIRYSSAAVNDLYEDLRRGEEWSDETLERADRIAFQDSIEVRNATFTYPGSAVPAISDVSLTIRRGASVGLVGATGSGKSTLLDVIVGFLDPDKGSVSVDGRDISTVRTAWLENLGVVPQSPFVLDATIRENVALRERSKTIDEERLQNALKLAQIYDFVNELPDGGETVLGERGVRLSGGERQRIAIARALYGDPDLLILDEGTAALDNRTEADLIKALEDLHGRHTLLMVAHRLSTIRNCDVIHVIENGRIVATGSYDELVERSTHFKNLTA